MVRIELLSSRNFNEGSLDDYKRTHRVENVYRKADGEYKLVSLPYIEDWDIEKKRQVAKSLMSDRYITYVATDAGEVVGFIGLIKKLHGKRMILDMMHVSAEYRGNGLGRKLFEKGMDTAREYGAAELYISACSSEETVAFYKAMGASLTTKPIESIANDEPYDLQMTCIL